MTWKYHILSEGCQEIVFLFVFFYNKFELKVRDLSLLNFILFRKKYSLLYSLDSEIIIFVTNILFIYERLKAYYVFVLLL